jgi:hypothetical protein
MDAINGPITLIVLVVYVDDDMISYDMQYIINVYNGEINDEMIDTPIKLSNKRNHNDAWATMIDDRFT